MEHMMGEMILLIALLIGAFAGIALGGMRQRTPHHRNDHRHGA